SAWRGPLVALAGWASLWWLSPTAAALPASLDNMRREAEQHEKDGHWGKALEGWAELLTKDRGLLGVRDPHQNCLGHLQQLRRHADKAFREQILNRDLATAQKVYGEVLKKLKANYADADAVHLSKLFRHGVDELILALNDDAFRQDHLPNAKWDAV